MSSPTLPIIAVCVLSLHARTPLPSPRTTTTNTNNTNTNRLRPPGRPDVGRICRRPPAPSLLHRRGLRAVSRLFEPLFEAGNAAGGWPRGCRILLRVPEQAAAAGGGVWEPGGGGERAGTVGRGWVCVGVVLCRELMVVARG